MPSPTGSSEGLDVATRPWVPYDRCWRWKRHDAYFAQRGIGAWLDGEVPHRATNNQAFAHQHAVLLLELVRALTAERILPEHASIQLLEVGGGLGGFAARLLLALREHLGAPGRALFERLTYLFSDVSEVSLRQAAETTALAPFVASGRLVPVLFDAREPASLRTLAGVPLSAEPLLVVANYVCCVLPTKVLRKHGPQWRELYVPPEPEPVAPTAPEGDTQPPTGWDELLGAHAWRPVALGEVFADGAHAEILERTAAASTEVELAYPYAFIELLAGLWRRMHPRGMLLCSDFADQSCAGAIGGDARCPILYGDSINHPVCFPLLTAAAAQQGCELLDSGDWHGITRTLLTSRGHPLPEPVCGAFDRGFVSTNAGQDRLDFEAAARALDEYGDHRRALLFFDRCLRLDPSAPELYAQAGMCCRKWGKLELALRYLRQGEASVRLRPYDFALPIGELLLQLGDAAAARQHFEASLRSGEDATKYLLLGQAHERLGDRASAYLAYRRALTLEPECAPVQQALLELRTAWCNAELDLDAVAERWWADKVRALESALANGGKHEVQTLPR
ncbi:tetratricopeptide repeat protein [Archangium violaceum]|uniref:tetratricopeptide repeat protein n=1 Tax=Archangium violaceum TaxID=83451 RepID=UPI0036DB68A1